MSKETLEEAAENRYPQGVYVINGIDICQASRECFIEGAKWMAERMYSEEHMRKCWNAAYIDALALDEETYKPLFYEDFIKQVKDK